MKKSGIESNKTIIEVMFGGCIGMRGVVLPNQENAMLNLCELNTEHQLGEELSNGDEKTNAPEVFLTFSNIKQIDNLINALDKLKYTWKEEIVKNTVVE